MDGWMKMERSSGQIKCGQNIPWASEKASPLSTGSVQIKWEATKMVKGKGIPVTGCGGP
jgi:hypothetical protein